MRQRRSWSLRPLASTSKQCTALLRIRSSTREKWATDVSVVKISLPRCEMHIKALEGK